jgi:small-conductance mechanosensitive channel
LTVKTFFPHCFLVWLLLSGTAGAQLPGLPKADAEPPASKKTEPVLPESIPIESMPLRIEQDQRRAQEIIVRSESLTVETFHEEELKRLKHNSDVLNDKTSVQNLQRMPIAGLESLERHLFFLNRELVDWQDNLVKQSRPFSEDAAALAEMRKQWQVTRQNSSYQLIPALEASIDSLIVDFDEAGRALAAPLSHSLSLSHDSVVVQDQITRNKDRVDSHIKSIDGNLLRVDSENLFHAIKSRSKSDKALVDAMTDGLQSEIEFMKEYDRVNSERNSALLILSLLTLPLFLWMARNAKSALAAGSRLQEFRTTLTRPVSAWLLLTLMVLVVMQLQGPILRLKFLLILAWWPVMRLQPKHVLDSVGNWMYLTAVFFIINLVTQLTSPLPLLFRLMVMANDILMLMTLVWLLYRTVKRLESGTKRQLLILRNLAAAGIAIMTAAIAANLAGNVSLAAVLTDATLYSGYFGLVLFALSTVVRAFTRFLFRNSVEKLKSSTQHAGGLVQVVSNLFKFSLVLAWIAATLNSFRVLRPLLEGLKSLSEFSIGYGKISITLGGILLFGISVYLSFWLAKTLRGVLSEDILPNMELPRGVANSISTLSYYSLLMLGLVLAVSAAGVEMSQLTIVLGALSVGIGFGLNTVINNFVSGLILMVERPVQPGDTIELSGTVGRVRDIGMRATTLTTFEGADVVVPNGMLLAEKMINWTLSSDKRRIDIPLGVAYGSDPNKVLALLAEVANATEGVSRNPAPTVLFTGFGANSLDFSVRAWTDSFDDSVFVRSGMAVRIHDALQQAGIEIPFPQRDLHVKSVDAGILSQFKRGDA